MNYRLLATCLILIAFISLVRPSPSVLRAAAMAAVMLVAMATRERGDSLPALGFAMAAVVAIDPWQSRDPGFALSVLATAGLLLVAPRATAFLQRWLPRKIAAVIAVPFSALALCLPIIIALSGYISPISILANIIAAPFVAPITIVGFIAALVTPISIVAAELLLALIRPFATIITSIARWAANFSVLEIRTGTIGFLIGVAFLIALVIFRKKALIALTVLAIIFLWWGRFPTGDWDVFICDVGQGDGYVINLEDHRAIVIDVGPDPILEDKCLRQLGITEIPLLILSHFHADHVGGLSGLLKGRKVSQVWISNNREPQIESTLSLAALNASEIITAQQGLIADVGQVKIEVLWPEANLRNFEELPGEGSVINNSSIAVVATTSNWSLFVAGDLEPPAQHELINRVGEVDIYKVCHHGSKYQDEGLMRALSAQIALISVGVGNPYGHPAPESIDTLTRLGTQVLRTDRDGAIAITAVAHHLRVRKSKGRIKVFYWS